MTQPVSPYRGNPVCGPPIDRAPAPATTTPNGTPAAGAAGKGGPSSKAAPPPDSDSGLRFTTPLLRAAAAAILRRHEQDTAIQRRLDAFLYAMTPTFNTPDGSVSVAVPFALHGYYGNQRQAFSPAFTARLNAAIKTMELPAETLGRIRAARASPEQIRAVTQALIDAGYLDPDRVIPLPDRVRQMMFDYGIGSDCAGYVREAHAWAKGRASATEAPADPIDDDLSNLTAHGYTRISELGDVRPGDVVVLAPPSNDGPGHRAIVYAQRWATDEDLTSLLACPGDGQPFVEAGAIRVVIVDSSWGSGDRANNGHIQAGGVQRDMWFYNEGTGKWAWAKEWTDGGRKVVASPMLYEHVLEGFYRQSPDMPSSPSAGTPR